MTDQELVEKKLAFIVTCVTQLRTLAQPDAIEHDVREERFVEHTLQLAIQAAIDVALHIVADERLGEPATNRDLFELLRRGGWVGAEQVAPLGNMASFRNVLVHGYAEVDVGIVKDVVLHHLDDLLDFVHSIRQAF
jgi:uncharacterized protein YutE (UPF0331/DUF86 family)